MQMDPIHVPPDRHSPRPVIYSSPRPSVPAPEPDNTDDPSYLAPGPWAVAQPRGGHKLAGRRQAPDQPRRNRCPVDHAYGPSLLQKKTVTDTLETSAAKVLQTQTDDINVTRSP